MTIDIAVTQSSQPDNTFTSVMPKAVDATRAQTGLAIMNISLANNGSFVGGSLDCTAGANDYTCTGGWWDLDPNAPVQTLYGILDPGVFNPNSIDDLPGRVLLAVAPGSPGGQENPSFPNPPDVTSPTGMGPHPVNTPFVYSVAPGATPHGAVLIEALDTNGVFSGNYVQGPQATMAELPPFPTGSDTAALFANIDEVAITTCAIANNTCIAIGRQSFFGAPSN